MKKTHPTFHTLPGDVAATPSLRRALLADDREWLNATDIALYKAKIPDEAAPK